MSGHPSFIPKGGGHGAAPRPRARPRRPRPGGPHDGRREGAGLRPHHEAHALLYGPVQGPASARAPVRRGLHRVLHRGSEGALRGHHGALRRRCGLCSRHRLDRFRRHRPHPSGDVGPVPAVGGVLVGAVLGHELHLAADVLPAARRHCEKDRPRALRIFREDLHRRHPLAHHQRRGHPGPEPQPGASPRPSRRQSRWWACLS